MLQKAGQPLLVLGGGGYSNPCTSRAWASMTAAIAEVNDNGHQTFKLLPEDVPDHDYFDLCVLQSISAMIIVLVVHPHTLP